MAEAQRRRGTAADSKTAAAQDRRADHHRDLSESHHRCGRSDQRNERQRTIEAMLASESRFRELFDNVIDGVYQSTADGKLLTVNPALVKMLGYESQKDLLQVDIKTLYVHPE